MNNKSEFISCQISLPFHIGDRICSKATGLPGVGDVVGYIIGHMYYYSVTVGKGSETKLSYKWDNLFPGWKEKMVYYIYYNEPRSACTWKEITEGLNYNDFPEYEWRDYYENKLPKTQLIAYPVDDLELFEDDLLITTEEVELMREEYNNDPENFSI